MDWNNIETPCFVLSEKRLLNNIGQFKKTLDKFFPNNILGYSVKTNSLPFLLSLIKNSGCYAEVVSHDEYRLASAIGFGDAIVYNGPMKSKESFVEAINKGNIVNIETYREIEWLKSLNFNQEVKVGIRININLSRISPEDCKDYEDFSRFGFSFENGELKKAIEDIEAIDHVHLVGIHLHRTSKTRSLNVYRNIIKYAIQIIDKFNLGLEYIDIGGGYFGDMPNRPTYEDYVEAIYEELIKKLDCSKITLIVEPGNAIIASPFYYLTSVIDTKNIDGHRIIVTDGTRNDVDPFFHKTDYFKSFIIENQERTTEKNQICVGCTCLENDILFKMEDSTRLEVGDIIKFDFTGAYTMCLSPLFIRYFPKVYFESDSGLKIVRDCWTEKEYLQTSIF